MNWGKWIVVAFLFFAAFIGTLVTVCVRQDISLVSKEYYKEELGFQAQLERQENTVALAVKPELRVENQSLTIRYDRLAEVSDAKLVMFNPGNSKLDKTFELNTTSDVQTIDVSDFAGGRYKAKLSWTLEGKEYYLEEIIFI